MNRPPRLTLLLLSLLALPAAAGTLHAVQKSQAAAQLEFGVKVALKGSWHEAAFRFQKAVDADAGNPRAWCNLAVARESLGEFDAARTAYEKAIERDPKDERIRENFQRFESYLKSNRRNPGAS